MLSRRYDNTSAIVVPSITCQSSEKNDSMTKCDKKTTLSLPTSSKKVANVTEVHSPSNNHKQTTAELNGSPATTSLRVNRRNSNTSLSAASDNNTTTLTPRDSIKEERRIKTCRRTLDDYLRKLSLSCPHGQPQQKRLTGIRSILTRPLSLNQETGTCLFPYQRFLVVIEVPQDEPKTVYVYTCVCRLEEGKDNISEVARIAMEMNYLQAATKGSTLGMRHSEVNLCRTIPLKALNPKKLAMVLEEFLSTASYVHGELERAKRSYGVSTYQQSHARMLIRPSKTTQNDVRSRTFTT